MSTATLGLTRTSKESSRPAVSSKDVWQEVFKSVSPLAEWESTFAVWREEIASLRSIEQASFFPGKDEAILQHVHRGWICSLMSEGEMLAVELLRIDSQATERMKFLNLCLENLQSTLETWHSAHEPPEELATVKG